MPRHQTTLATTTKKCFTHREKTQAKKRGEGGSIKQDYIQKTQAIDRSIVTDTHLHLPYQLYRKEKKGVTPETNRYQQIGLPLGRSQAVSSFAGTSTVAELKLPKC